VSAAHKFAAVPRIPRLGASGAELDMTNHPSRSKKRARQAQQFAKLAAAFNEWQRRYLANPTEFENEAETLSAFIRDLNAGRTPDLGERQAAYLMKLMGEIS
jgi:hypothetical protein